MNWRDSSVECCRSLTATRCRFTVTLYGCRHRNAALLEMRRLFVKIYSNKISSTEEQVIAAITVIEKHIVSGGDVAK